MKKKMRNAINSSQALGYVHQSVMDSMGTNRQARIRNSTKERTDYWR